MMVIVLSDEATAFKNKPAPMPFVEDIYSISDRRAWVVVCTEFAAERKVEERLREAKVSTFLPIERAYVRKQVMRPVMVAGMVQRRRAKTTRRPVDRPLLPGYLFAQLPAREISGRCERLEIDKFAAARISHFDGVSTVLGSAAGALPIPADFVDLLKRQQGIGAFDRTNSRPNWAQVGCEVRVADGPFASFLAIVEEHLPNHMLKVAVEIFGRATPVTLELAQLEKAW